MKSKINQRLVQIGELRIIAASFCRLYHFPKRRISSTYSWPLLSHTTVLHSEPNLIGPCFRPRPGGRPIHRMKWRHSSVHGHIPISMLWSNTAYCVKLSSDDLSHYSDNIESVGLRNENVRITTILLRKWCHNNKHFSELAPQHGRKAASII